MAPNALIGCTVLLSDQQILLCATHTKYHTGHAETQRVRLVTMLGSRRLVPSWCRTKGSDGATVSEFSWLRATA